MTSGEAAAAMLGVLHFCGIMHRTKVVVSLPDRLEVREVVGAHNQIPPPRRPPKRANGTAMAERTRVPALFPESKRQDRMGARWSEYRARLFLGRARYNAFSLFSPLREHENSVNRRIAQQRRRHRESGQRSNRPARTKTVIAACFA